MSWLSEHTFEHNGELLVINRLSEVGNFGPSDLVNPIIDGVLHHVLCRVVGHVVPLETHRTRWLCMRYSATLRSPVYLLLEQYQMNLVQRWHSARDWAGLLAMLQLDLLSDMSPVRDVPGKALVPAAALRNIQLRRDHGSHTTPLGQ